MSPPDGIGIGSFREAEGLALGDIDVGSEIGPADFFTSLLEARVDLNEFVLADLLGGPTALAPVVCVNEVLHVCLSGLNGLGAIYVGAFAIRVLDEAVQVERFIYLVIKFKCKDI